MQLSDDANTILTQQVSPPQLPQSFKFNNLKRDSTHGNNSYHSNDPLINPQLSPNSNTDDESKDHEDSDEEGENNINVVVTLETSLHSLEGESKQEDGRFHSNSHFQNDEGESKEESKEDSEYKSTEETSKQSPSSRSLLRRKSSLSVRTVEESLSTGCLKKSSNRANMSDFSISWNKLHTREYEIKLVINPSCGGGPAIGIGDKFTELEDIDLREKTDKENDKPEGPYDKNEIYLKPYDRLNMLKKNGYTDSEIIEVILQTKELAKQRTKSAIAKDKDEERMEKVNKVAKKFKKLCRTKEQKKHDKIVKSFINR